VNTQQIKYVTAVARHLSFTKAARSVHLSQPALSKQIALLESELGFDLFVRTSRSVRLTSAGVVLLKELEHISSLLESAIENARAASTGKTGSLSVGCLEALDIQEFLPDVIAAFIKEYPDIKLSLERKSFKALLDALYGGTLDIVFTYSFEVGDRSDLDCQTIAEMPGAIVLHETHPLAGKNTVQPEDLKDDPLIIISESESSSGNRALLQFLEMNGFHPLSIKQAPNLESILLYLELGVGYSVLSRYNRLYRNPSLQFIDLPHSPEIGVVAAWKKDIRNSAVPLFVQGLP
jgi:DNA-binding transcriptional LysR family regulator